MNRSISMMAMSNRELSVLFCHLDGGGSPATEAGLTADLLTVLQTPRRIRAADNRLRAASALAVAAALDVIADTEKSYQTANALGQEMALLKHGAVHIDRLLQIAMHRLDAGEGTRLDVATLEARCAETRIDLQVRRLKFMQEQLALARLLGQPSGDTDWQQSTPLPVAAPA